MKVVVWMTTKHSLIEKLENYCGFNLFTTYRASSNHNNGLKHANFQLCMFDLAEV